MVEEKLINEALVNELYTEVFGKSPNCIEQITGLGFANKVYQVNLCDEINIIKLPIIQFHSLDLLTAYNEYSKEMFCMEQAEKAGILTAKVISVDKYKDIPFIIQSYIDGVNGSLYPDKSKLIWASLGKYAKILHSVEVKGYGLSMKEYGVFHNYAADFKEYGVEKYGFLYNSFNPTLKSHIEYNINCIGQEDKFVKLDIYSTENVNQIKEAFISLLDINFELGLMHGDIKPINTIIKDDKVFLIDFGCARVGIIPFDEFIWLNSYGNIEKEFIIFREAYGISNEIFMSNERILHILSMLNEFDILRWSLYHNIDDPYRIQTAKQSVKSFINTERTV